MTNTNAAKAIDINDAHQLTLMLQTKESERNPAEKAFCKQIRSRINKQQGGDVFDFNNKDSSSGNVRDGNTIFANRYVRRGLPVPSADLVAPRNMEIELVTYLKPNGDCAMFSYLAPEKLFLIATRNTALLVRDEQQLAEAEGKYTLHKQIGALFFAQVRKDAVKNHLSGRTMIGEYLSKENLVVYPEEMLLMHSIVDNQSGDVLADANTSIAALGFQAVPSKSAGTFILEEEQLQARLNELAKKIRCLSLA